MGAGASPSPFTGSTPKEQAAGVQSSGKNKNGPPPQDYKGAAEQQSQANAQLNRPDVSTPYASQQWSKGPDGQWRMTTGFNGPLGGAFDSLGGQAANSLSKPVDFSGLPQLDSGQQARDQAINAAYGQATSRLNPQWDQRDAQLRQRLANQGLDPDSEAGKNALAQESRDRNDAYNSALSSAIGQGTAAGNQVFQNSAMAHQLAQADALRQRELPLQDLSGLQGLLQMPGFNQVAGPDYFNAALATSNDAFRRWQAQQQQQADEAGGFGQLLQAGAQAVPFLL